MAPCHVTGGCVRCVRYRQAAVILVGSVSMSFAQLIHPMPVLRRSSRTPRPREVFSPLPVATPRRRKQPSSTPRRETLLPTPASSSAAAGPSSTQRVTDEAPVCTAPLPTPPPTLNASTPPVVVPPRRSERRNLGTPAPRFEIPVHVPRQRQPRPVEPDGESDIEDIVPDVETADAEEEGIWVTPLARDPAEALPELHYLGPMNRVCPCCRTLHWKEEATPPGRSRQRARLNTTPFSLCCGRGSVDLRPLPALPEELEDLFRSPTAGKPWKQNIS